MRVFIKGLVLGCIIIMFWSTGDVLFSSRMFLGEARIHTVQQGEQLSRLAQQYYGNADYWRELALINRAPRADDIFPGERILLPSVNAMDKLARARRLTQVNELVSMEAQLALQESQDDAEEFATKIPVAQKMPKSGSARPQPTPKQVEPVETTKSAPATAQKQNDAPVISQFRKLAVTDEPVQAEVYTDSGAPDDHSPGWLALTLFGAGLFGLGWVFMRYRRKRRDKTGVSLRVSADNILENFEKNYARNLPNPKHDNSGELPAADSAGAPAENEKELVL